MTAEEINQKLKELREKYKQSAGVDRKIIEAQGKLLNWYKERKQL